MDKYQVVVLTESIADEYTAQEVAEGVREMVLRLDGGTFDAELRADVNIVRLQFDLDAATGPEAIRVAQSVCEMARPGIQVRSLSVIHFDDLEDHPDNWHRVPWRVGPDSS